MTEPQAALPKIRQIMERARLGRCNVRTASVPVYPSDQQISATALPQLIQETIATDSANINAVSGATYTSQGYISSLQSAIDKAGH